MSKKIIIFGAGISGLTIAHELVEKGFNVEIYEKDSINGGMARSFRDNNDVPTEHSWRGYGPFYKNLYDILNRIPLPNSKVNIETFSSARLEDTQRVFPLEEVIKHNKENDAWCTYENNVYNITDYISKHPGGSIIKNAIGKDLSEVWTKFGVAWHMDNSSVLSKLERYKIGKLSENFSDLPEKFLDLPENFSDSPNIKTKTVNDNLRSFKMMLLKNKVQNHNNKINIDTQDYPYLIYLFSKSILSNNRREEYYKTRLYPLLDKKVSEVTKAYLLDYVSGPGFGFDKNNISVCHYSLFLFRQLLSGNKDWSVMNAPTNEAWIDIWVNYLKSKGVKIFNNSTLKNIIKNKNNEKEIDYCIIQANNINKIVKGDEYIISINPNYVEEICINSNLTDLALIHNKLNTINNQISFRLGFNKKIDFPKKRLGFVLMDSPYNITFYPQEDNWDTNIKLGMNGKIKSLWSGTIILPYIKGSLTNKSAISLNKDELLKEIIYQFFESKDLKSIMKQDITEKDIIHKEIFEDWFWNGNNLESKNKKWVNNTYNEEFRPDNKTNYNNLYLAGSHTKTEISIWSMESAVESGKNASNYILSKYKINKCIQYNHKFPILIDLIGKIDDILYALNLPNIVDVSLFIILVFIIIFIYNNKKNPAWK